MGDFGVGKTSLIRRFVQRKFNEQYISTVGAKISRKLVEVQNGFNKQKKNIQLLIWDIEGKSKFESLIPTYLRGAKGVIIVGDISRPITIEHIRQHLDLFSQINPHAKAITIAINKLDLATTKQAQELLEKYNLKLVFPITNIYLTSAKTGNNVDEMFQKLASRLIDIEFDTR